MRWLSLACSIVGTVLVLAPTGCRKAEPVENRQIPELPNLSKQFSGETRESAGFALRVEPASITLYPGGKDRLKVTAQRHGYQGPIDLEVRHLPAAVEVPKGKIAAGQSSVELEFTASSRLAPESKTDVNVLGSADRDRVSSSNFTVNLRELPFTLQVEPEQVEVPQGGSGQIKVTAKRKDYPGPIAIEMRGFPANVRAAPATIPPGRAEVMVPIAAAAQVPEGITKNLLANGFPAGKGVQISSGPFALQVLGPPFSLQIDAEAKVPYEGGKIPLKVKATRRDYRGPISVVVNNLPGGIRADRSTILAGQQSAEIEIIASAGLPASVSTVQVQGIANAAPNRQAFSPGCKLQVEGHPFRARVEPALVPLVQGAKAKCKLEITRRSYDGPIQVDLKGLRGEVAAAAVTIPRGKTSAVLELTVADKAALGDRHGIQVVGTALDRNRLVVPAGAFAVRVQEPFSLVAQPGSIQLKEGTKATLKVTAIRRTYKGPIELAVKNLPAQVSAGTVVLAEGKDQADIEVSAGNTAPSSSRGDVHVVGTADTRRQAVTQNILVAVAGKLFDLAVRPDNVSISFGDKATIKVVAMRKNYKGPIAVELRNLPKEVSAARATIPAGKNEVAIELEAGLRASAEKKNDSLAVGTAVAGGNVQVLSPHFQVDLKPGLVELDIEPKILKVSHGTGAKLKVLANRRGYQGPIAVHIERLPKGFKAGRVTIAEKMTQAEIDVQAEFSVTEGDTVDVYAHGVASLVERTVLSPRFMVRVASVGQPAPIEVTVAPAVIQLTRGGSAKVKVSILRRKHDGPVHVELRNLPLGIEASKGNIPRGQNSVDITVRAAAGAELGSRADVCAVASMRTSLIDTTGHGNFASQHVRVNVVRK